MKLELQRIALRAEYTIGKLYVNGEYVCDTLEDTVRDINRNGRFDNGETKIPGRTAIPYGNYEITLNVVSPKFSKRAAYARIGGRLPRLLNVPSFSGILIHIGNKPEDTEGCILVGKNTITGRLTSSTKCFDALYDKLLPASRRGEKITIEIV